jgi:hypothetical protein
MGRGTVGNPKNLFNLSKAKKYVKSNLIKI